MSSSLHRCGKRLGEISGVFFLRKTEDMMMFRETNTEWSTAVNV